MGINFSAIRRDSPIGFALRSILRLMPAATRVRVLQGPLRGHKWIVGAGVHGYWLGSYEWEKQRAFESAVARGSVVFDIGANVGYYTLLAAKLVGPPGRVIAFEPSPRNLRYLESHVRLNNLVNVDVWPFAVTQRAGTVLFDLSPNSHMGHVSDSGSVEVRTICLDDAVERGQLPVPDVIKMDIEGGEVDALEGARRLLASRHPIVFLATHGDEAHRWCCALLSGLAYRVRPLRDGVSLTDTDEIVAEAPPERTAKTASSDSAGRER